MPTYAWTGVLFASAVALFAAEGPKPAPKQMIELTIGGVSHVVENGSSVVLEQGGKPVQVSLRPEVTFAHRGLSFQYPSSFAFQDDSDPEFEHYNMDGQNAIIIVQWYPEDSGVDFPAVVKGICEQFRVESKKVREAKAPNLRLRQGGQLQGRRVDAVLAGATIRQDLYAIPQADGLFMLIIQDCLQEDGSQSLEFGQLVEQLGATMILPPVSE